MNGIYLFWLFIVTGLLVSLNPMAIAIFTALLAGSLGKGHGKSTFYGVAFSFLVSFWTFTAFIGMLFALDLNNLSVKNLGAAGILTATALIVWGLWAIRDFFWYKHKGGLPKRLHAIIHRRTTKKTGPLHAAALGAITASASLVNTGLAIIGFALVSTLFYPGTNYWMLVLAFILITPLLIVFLLAAGGIRLSAIIKWKEDTKQLMRLTVGAAAIVLGWFILLVINGSLQSVLL